MPFSLKITLPFLLLLVGVVLFVDGNSYGYGYGGSGRSQWAPARRPVYRGVPQGRVIRYSWQQPRQRVQSQYLVKRRIQTRPVTLAYGPPKQISYRAPPPSQVLSYGPPPRPSYGPPPTARIISISSVPSIYVKHELVSGQTQYGPPKPLPLPMLVVHTTKPVTSVTVSQTVTQDQGQGQDSALLELLQTTFSSLGVIALKDNAEVGRIIVSKLGEDTERAEKGAELSEIFAGALNKIQGDLAKLGAEAQKEFLEKYKEGLSQCGKPACVQALTSIPAEPQKVNVNDPWTTKISDLLDLLRQTLSSAGVAAIKENAEVGREVIETLNKEIEAAEKLQETHTQGSDGGAIYEQIAEIFVSAESKIAAHLDKLPESVDNEIFKLFSDALKSCDAEPCRTGKRVSSQDWEARIEVLVQLLRETFSGMGVLALSDNPELGRLIIDKLNAEIDKVEKIQMYHDLEEGASAYEDIALTLAEGPEKIQEHVGGLKRETKEGMKARFLEGLKSCEAKSCKETVERFTSKRK